MCKPAICATCGNKSWWGCGSHVPSVMDSHDKATWCTCEPKVEKEGVQYPPMAAQASS